MKYLTRNIWLLSLVSLFNDISSEMLYPVMPLFLQSIGFSSVFIGILEGVAEATAGLSKAYFGTWSDAIGRRLPFVQFGYFLSAISKPMMVMFSFPLWIFGARTTDKLGKGIRTAARDAILSDEATADNKGKVFGFHRAMDTLGAAIGPSLALAFILWKPNSYKLLFLIAFIPGILGTLLTFLLKEKRVVHAITPKFNIKNSFSYLSQSSAKYKQLVGLLILFTLFNSSDIFLLLRIKQITGNDSYTIAAYILYNLVYALAAFPIGIIADKIGLKKMLAIGLLTFALVYLGFGLNTTFVGFLLLFTLYGIYSASTEGVSKALISNIAPAAETASAIGTFAALSSIASLIASVWAGVVWKYISPQAAFLISASITSIVGLTLMYTKIIPDKR